MFLTSVVAISQRLSERQSSHVFNPERDPLGNGYHIMQSKIALGSGGIFGKATWKVSESFNFLPEMQTDFIFLFR